MIAQFFLVLAIVVLVAQASQIGFGVQRLKKHTNKVVLKAGSCENVEELWYTDAVVDNFAPIEDQVKWANKGQRYWLNKQFWTGPGAPIFVFIGGEGQESCSRLSSRMYIYDLAQQHNGLMVDVEHRFYGQSYPTVDMSTENLKYLSSTQALADLARIIGFIKKSLGTEHSQVITIGGSYPGNLAAWFKLKYPSVSHGSIASSAPLTAKVNFYEYMEVVADAINYFSGKKCYDSFEKAANHIAYLASQGIGSDGMKQLEKDFVTCSPIGNQKDLGVLLSDLMGNIQGTVQYNNEHSGVMNVTDICNVMVQSDDSYANFVQLTGLYRQANGMTCEDASWADMIAYLADPTMDPNNAARPWVYQTCNEFGYYQTADSLKQPFHAWKPLNLDFSRDMCRDSYNGWESDPQVDWINQMYGDVHIAGTNIVFPAGTIDPWHALGVTNSTAPLTQPTESPVYILGTAHCNDLYAPANSDPPSLTNARAIIADTVAKWLKR